MPATPPRVSAIVAGAAAIAIRSFCSGDKPSGTAIAVRLRRASVIVGLVATLGVGFAASSSWSDAVAAPLCDRGPEYYAFPLIATKHIPGTGLATATAEISFSHTSPYAIAVTENGSYDYDLVVRVERMKPPRQGTLVAWVTTPEIDEIERIGALDAHLQAAGRVAWNKFLVVITLEATDDDAAPKWGGPVVFRGVSRSGMMHTMVGHGALQQENCAAYGYDD